MGRESCLACAKHSLILLCVLLCIAGGAFLAHALSTRYEGRVVTYADHLLKAQNHKEEKNIDKIHLALYMVMATSGVTIIVGLLGTYGAVCEHFYLLITFLVLAAFLLILKIAIVVMVSMKFEDAKTMVIDIMDQSVKDYYESAHSDPGRQFLDMLQRYLSCCGCKGGRQDYNSTNENNTVPDSCGDYVDPCCDKVWWIVATIFYVVAGVAGALAFVELMALFFGSYLAHYTVDHEVVRRGRVTLILDKEIDRQAQKGKPVKHDGGGGEIDRSRKGDAPSSRRRSFRERVQGSWRRVRGGTRRNQPTRGDKISSSGSFDDQRRPPPQQQQQQQQPPPPPPLSPSPREKHREFHEKLRSQGLSTKKR